MISVKCPICGRPMAGPSLSGWPQFPFCGPRCKTIDLGRWLGESYRVPTEEPEEPAFEERDVP
jgi:endogenous inhibitor of DNA gyrase (YacG/DUF329 family)